MNPTLPDSNRSEFKSLLLFPEPEEDRRRPLTMGRFKMEHLKFCSVSSEPAPRVGSLLNKTWWSGCCLCKEVNKKKGKCLSYNSQLLPKGFCHGEHINHSLRSLALLCLPTQPPHPDLSFLLLILVIHLSKGTLRFGSSHITKNIWEST